MGRPRDPSIDDRALQATRELLIEQGFAATTVKAVALRSGVHASAIYRRWPNRLALIHDAAFSDLPPGRIRPTGHLRRDLAQFVRAYVATFELPVVRSAMPGILSSMGTGQSPALDHLSVRPQFRQILAAAPKGEVDDGVNPDDIFDLLLGAILVRILVPEGVRSQSGIDGIVVLIIRALEPRPHAGQLGLHQPNDQ